MTADEYISLAPTITIFDSLVKAQSVLQNYHNILVSVSGGADSDNMIDVVEHLRSRDSSHIVTYVWFDTGIEMEATKHHLSYLEQKYGITFIKRKPETPVAAAVRKYGYPYISKETSKNIHQLQKNGFDFENETYSNLVNKYPNCKSELKWFTGEKGKYSISKVRREYISKNPPQFVISDLCCSYSKKKPTAQFEKEISADIVFLGIRKMEGGVRASKTKCFDRAGKTHKTDRYYPCFWWTDEDKSAFEKTYGIIHSEAYTVYGFKRTGCAGCPFNSNFDNDLEILKQYEPRLANAVEHIFAPSYEYTRNYRTYKEARKRTKEKLS